MRNFSGRLFSILLLSCSLWQAGYAFAGTWVYPQGTEVTVVEIDPSDGFSIFKGDFEGKTGIAQTELLSTDGGTWWSGRIKMESGFPADFLKVKLSSSVAPTLRVNDTPSFDVFGKSYPSVENAIPGSFVVSNAVSITGIDVSVPVSVTGGEYAVDSGAFTSAVGSVSANQTVTLRVTAPLTLGGVQTANLTVGRGATSFSVTTTTAGDYAPEAFSFVPVTEIAPETVVESEAIAVGGIDTSTSISVVGGEYSINSGSWTSSSGTASLGNQIKLRLTAPSGYGQTGSATLTIGGVSASFSVSTRSFTPVTTASQVFSNPQTVTVVDSTGVVRLTAAPAAPLQLASNALENAVIVLDTSAAISVQSGNATLSYTRREDDTTFQVRTIGDTPALTVTQGSVDITAPSANTTIPVAGDGGSSATLLTSTPNTQIVAGRDENRNLVVAVTSGPVTYRNGSSRRGMRAGGLPNSFTVYPGEAVIADDTGTAGQVRLGSFEQSGGSQTGDHLANVPRAATTLRVPRVTGNSSRFNTDWTAVLGQALASHVGGTYQSLGQDSTTGVLTLVTSTGTYRYLPVGDLALATAALNDTSRAVSVADIAANLTAILDSSLSFAVAPATAYADLETVLKSISATATLEILGDGVLKASLNSTDFIAQPAAQTNEGSTAGCPGFVAENNQLMLCDTTGRRQALSAAFADTDTLRSTFRHALNLPSLTVTNNGMNGTYTADVGVANFTLTPDIVLTAPPSAQAGNLWWIDEAGKIFIRYPSGAAQGFALQ